MERTAGAAGNGEVVHIAFYFDVMCPWAYQTSKWIRTVRTEVPLDIEWRFASLEEFNHDEGKKHPWEREWSYGWGMLRVAAMLRRQSMEACDRFYEAAGRALHEEGRKPHRPEVAEEICGALGYDPGVVREAIADTTTGDEVKAEHDQLVAVGGFGVPTIVFPDGQHVFGPVVVPAPTGADAQALWDLTVAYTRVPNLFELKTPKDPAAMQHIARNFEPYLRARDWESREKPAP